MTRLDLPHRRYNPLLDEWVLVSPHRLQRPWQGQVEPPAAEARPAYDPECYLCPGNARAGGKRNPPYTSTFAFDNDYPALLPDVPSDEGSADGLLRARNERGICRVVCFSPRHDLTLARMDAAGIRGVVDAWAEQVSELGARRELRHVQVFENKGAEMGASNPHPHCQVWATEHVPSFAARRLAAQRRHVETGGADLLGDYLAQEEASGERIVCENERWTVVVPFWAVWPFEAMLIPRRHVADLPALDADERDALADILGRVNRRFDNLFQRPFPYSMAWHGRPTDGGAHPYCRLHASWYPPLLRSATVRKFIVGYELAAEPQRDLTPEQAAARLREVPERHYLDQT
ncbi:MAG TPA: UDP-glucose--hexose-1-phosphate uridylyltransferase [Vicinamibacteria bacterium]